MAGVAITYPAATCPLCQSSLIQVSRRRLLLRAAVIVELLVIPVVSLAGKPR
jgi:hypothetical protein